MTFVDIHQYMMTRKPMQSSRKLSSDFKKRFERSIKQKTTPRGGN